MQKFRRATREELSFTFAFSLLPFAFRLVARGQRQLEGSGLARDERDARGRGAKALGLLLCLSQTQVLITK